MAPGHQRAVPHAWWTPDPRDIHVWTVSRYPLRSNPDRVNRRQIGLALIRHTGSPYHPPQCRPAYPDSPQYTLCGSVS
eukprot:7388598-Prymnesium_polylepis.1